MAKQVDVEDVDVHYGDFLDRVVEQTLRETHLSDEVARLKRDYTVVFRTLRRCSAIPCTARRRTTSGVGFG